MPKVKLFLFWPLLLALLAMPRPAAAHPHVWVDYAVTVVFHDQGLAGFHLQWTFDEMFSEQIRDLAGLQGRQPTPEQTRLIQTELFDNLRNYRYFTRIWIDGQEFRVQFVRDFQVRFTDNRAVYEFFVPCTVAAITTPKQIRFLAMDPEIFVDFTWDARRPVGIEHPPSLRVTHELREEPSLSLFGGLFAPRALHFQFQRAS
ncbi:DUF1007 family protein [Geoalkalibacter halelectricus]|uniref:DUF1007 family protein n=1 Tax=Geoalkalibacter halelectricus TaxID=2847045 RepID=A0ABY5ZQF9_9BACT|nr:DUF1007 family protein [Geoalkalibacter halelectricus]MDO3378566.1 DUF1007 family protein [Geoalkalibacter halelectricus]UWZ80120.1 DUF1007 family protein [Geoalkalibacter halelectricus]